MSILDGNRNSAFKSLSPCHLKSHTATKLPVGRVAHTVERQTFNLKVVGSSPTLNFVTCLVN